VFKDQNTGGKMSSKDGKRKQWTGWGKKIDGKNCLVVSDGENIIVLLNGKEVIKLPNHLATVAGVRRSLSSL